MNNKGQGDLRTNNQGCLFIHTLLLITFLVIPPAHSDITSAQTTQHDSDTQKNHVFILYSRKNTLHSEISKKISGILSHENTDFTVSELTSTERIEETNNDSDIIIGIGPEGIKNATRLYPKANKLFISTDPKKFRPDPDTNRNNAVLYMTQSYCQQFQFIKLLNVQWETVSILNSQGSQIDSETIRQCAIRHEIKTYIVNVSAEENITAKIKHALQNSDVLLALPDKQIFNSNTVKNILLTSYRYRKPVIAFSRNFVNAGALASIHSNVEQIAQSASELIEQYYEREHRFESQVNYPRLFDISSNRQVFKALNLSQPDIKKIKQVLLQQETKSSRDKK